MGKAKMLGFSKPLPHNSRQGNKAPWQGGKKKIILPKENTCVCCDVIIPEGRQVCPSCEIKENGEATKFIYGSSPCINLQPRKRYRE